MSVYFFNYSSILGKAMQQVVRSVLAHVAESGLPGQHHFYISFSTQSPGVLLPARVLDKYPEQITIVLQHEFDHLKTDSTGFEVELVFDGIKEDIRVPFDSLIAFSDPYANFSMQFDVNEWHSGDMDDIDDDEDAEYDENAMHEIQQNIADNLASDLLSDIKSNDNTDEDELEGDKRTAKLIFIEDYLDK